MAIFFSPICLLVVFTHWKEPICFQKGIKILGSLFRPYHAQEIETLLFITRQRLPFLCSLLCEELWFSLPAVPLARMQRQPIHSFFLEILFSHISCCCICLWPSQCCQGASSSHWLLHASGCFSLSLASPVRHCSFPFLPSTAVDTFKFLWPPIWLSCGHEEGFSHQPTSGI